MLNRFIKVFKRLDIDLLFLAEASLVFYGLYQVYHPTAFIALGVADNLY